ncbi:hypothetical protein E2C01_088231 [Portunus trituberculatus]|uniref:Uncharacterized protein n=1 Tax=Portunus trituberculatus TaxID=210409 RepID=A0A5B7J8N3_PORTR|nr:hypothetical protein [Portunus trituberculatus]
MYVSTDDTGIKCTTSATHHVTAGHCQDGVEASAILALNHHCLAFVEPEMNGNMTETVSHTFCHLSKVRANQNHSLPALVWS